MTLVAKEPKIVKVKVLEYQDMYHGIYCGRAKVEFLEGDTITIPVVNRFKVGDELELYESETS